MSKKMDEAKLKEMIYLRNEKHLTYREIGEIFGVSRQFIHQEIAEFSTEKGWHRRPSEKILKKILFPAVSEWMKENRFTINRIAKAIHSEYIHVYRCFTWPGYDIPKHTIDGLIRLTGIPYEKLFAEKEDSEK